MDAQEKYDLLEELNKFLEGLKKFKRHLENKDDISLLKKNIVSKLREELIRKTGALKPIIIELTGKEYISRFGIAHNIWDVGLTTHRTSDICDVALDYCIDAVNEAIGKLESAPLTELKLPKASVAQKPKDTAESPNQIFDKMQFHPKVIEASRKLFKDGHYRDAILRAFIEVNNFAKEKTGLELDGKALMAQVFKKENPVIKLNELRNKTEKDEQEGFMFLFMGAMVGIRNPKAHDNIVQTDPHRTLEYLGFASLLMKRIEEGEVNK